MNDFQKYVSQNKDRAKAVGPGVYRIPLVQEELTPSFKLNSPYMQGAENGGLYAFVDSTGNIIPNQDIEYDPSDNQYYKVHHLPDAKVEAPSLSAYNDPNYTNILTGNYYGHKFVPTEQNVKYYQKLYENDHKIREGYGPHGLAQLGGVLGVGAALATTGAYAPTIAGWTYRTALPWFAENLAVPTIVAGSVDLAQNALFGTTSSQTVSNFLQDKLHVPQLVADIAGEATNPGWYVPSSYGVKLWNGAERLVTKGLNNGIKSVWPYIARRKMPFSPLYKVYLNNPQLQKIGTASQYVDYVQNIFPESQVKGVVYHGGKPGIKTFKVPSENTASDAYTGTHGIYFTPKKRLAKQYSIWANKNPKEGQIYPVVLNIKNGIRYDHYTPFDFMSGWNRSKFSVDHISDYWYNRLNLGQYDGIIQNRSLNGTSRSQIAVFDPKNIHILGDSNDVKGFQNFINSPKKVMVDNQSSPLSNLPIQWNLTPKAIVGDILNNKLALGVTASTLGVTGFAGKLFYDLQEAKNKLKSIYSDQNRSDEDIQYMKHYYGLDDPNLSTEDRKQLLQMASEDGFDLSNW